MCRRAVPTVAIAVGLMLSACSPPTEQHSQPLASNSDDGRVNMVVPSGVYRLDPLHAALTWTIPHNSLSNYMARFTQYDVVMRLDRDALDKSEVEVVIDPRSVVTHYPADFLATHPTAKFQTWDEQIGRGAQFLNGDTFPTITFKSTKIEMMRPRAGRVTGDLTFLGVTRPVTLDVSLNGQQARHPLRGVPAVGFSAKGRIRPADFGMKLAGGLGDTVTVTFDGELLGQRAASRAPAP